MELNYKNVQQLNSQQILDLLLPDFSNIYESFNYIEISKNEFYVLVLDSITKSKKMYNGDVLYKEYIESVVTNRLIEHVKLDLSKPDKAVIILNNYINKFFKVENDLEDRVKKLECFFEIYNYIPRSNLLIKVIEKNEFLSKTIELIIDKYKDDFSYDILENQFNDSVILLFIKTYCSLNNILLNDEVKVECEKKLLDDVNFNEENYFQQIKKIPLLSIEEEQNLIKRALQGEIEAKNLLVCSNLRLVNSIAKKYIGRGVPLQDLIQEGSIGLMKAIDKFDLSKGVKFSTYATYWIRQVITRSIYDVGKDIRIPVYLYKKINSYKDALQELRLELNRYPTLDEVAAKMDLPISEVTELLKSQGDVVSMNTLVNDENDTELQDFIPNTDESPDELAITTVMQEQVRDLIQNSSLSQREIEILMLRFGFNDNKIMTLEEIGKKLNITKSRVGQIEAQALIKLRKSKKIKQFAEYMSNPEQALKRLDEFRKYYYENNRAYKSFLYEDKVKQKIEVGEHSMPRKLKSIYEYLSDYSKEQIDELIEELPEEDKELIKVRYGSDLSKPVIGKLSKNQRDRFYGSLIPKMRKNLNKKSKAQNINKIVQSDSRKNDYTEQLKKVNQSAQVPFKTNLEDSNIKESEELITKDDYIKMLELLRTPNFSQMIAVLTVKEAVIISLKLGYVNGEYFSTEAIAQFLGIEKAEVIETTKKVLLLYKENINQFIDHAVEVIEKSKIKK